MGVVLVCRKMGKWNNNYLGHRGEVYDGKQWMRRGVQLQFTSSWEIIENHMGVFPIHRIRRFIQHMWVEMLVQLEWLLQVEHPPRIQPNPEIPPDHMENIEYAPTRAPKNLVWFGWEISSQWPDQVWGDEDTHYGLCRIPATSGRPIM